MSTLDRGRNVNVEESVKELMRVVGDFYIEKDVEQKTELNDPIIDNMGKTQYKQWIQKTKFGVNIDYEKRIIKPKMVKLVSRKRMGRTEAMNVLQAQLAQILQHPAQGLKRALGIGL